MRIMGFQRQWVNQLTGKPKLSEEEFTTFRWPRRDRDWVVDETVQIVMNPRTKERIPQGEAIIVSKEPRTIINANPNFYTETPHITDSEAQMDGFLLAIYLIDFLIQGKPRHWIYPVNRLTLRWTRRYND